MQIGYSFITVNNMVYLAIYFVGACGGIYGIYMLGKALNRAKAGKNKKIQARIDERRRKGQR